MKCLPREKVGIANGCVLHDWHAEVLALRAFNRFLVDECADLGRRGFGEKGEWVRWREKRGTIGVEETESQDQPFAMQEDMSIHMYCSEAPCGDASMELTMAEQEDATPWPSFTSSAVSSTVNKPGSGEAVAMLGRGHFDQLGIVRRKPARPDAPVTWSKSCSDKLALKQCTGLLSGVVSLLVWPGNVYLDSVVLPKAQSIASACERAFGAGGRMAAVASEDVQRRWRSSGYAFRPFEVRTTGREFEFSKRSSPSAIASEEGEKAVPSNISALYTPRRQEILISGVLQGRKQFDLAGASCVSRRSLWKAVLDVASAGNGLGDMVVGWKEMGYGEVKESAELAGREAVKRNVRELALKGWRRNLGDE